MLEHGRTPGTAKFKILKPGCTLIFSLPVSCELELSRNTEAGHSSRGSELTLMPVAQDRFSSCSRHLEESAVQQHTRIPRDGTRENHPAVHAMKMLWKNPFRFRQTRLDRK